MSTDQPPVPPTPPPAQPYSPPPPPQPLSEMEGRTWAMIAHLSVLLNLVTGFLGVFVPLLLYLVYKDRSRYVANQSMQAFVFQLVWWGGGGLIIAGAWAISTILSTVTFGLAAIVCVPGSLIISVVAALMPLVALVYGVYAGIQANNGQPFRYWLIGDWVTQRVPA